MSGWIGCFPHTASHRRQSPQRALPRTPLNRGTVAPQSPTGPLQRKKLLCFEASSEVERTFTPFAGRGQTAGMDICQLQFGTGRPYFRASLLTVRMKQGAENFPALTTPTAERHAARPRVGLLITGGVGASWACQPSPIPQCVVVDCRNQFGYNRSHYEYSLCRL